MPSARALTRTLAALAALATVPAVAGDRVALNQVWSRLADVNGELGSVEVARISPDSRFVVSGTKFDYSVIMWRLSDGTELWRRTLPQEVEKIAWSRDGRHVIVGGEDRLLRLLRASDGASVREVRHEEGIDSVEVSPDGRFVASGQEKVRRSDGGAAMGAVRLFGLPDMRPVARRDVEGTINEVDFSPDGRLLVAASDTGDATLMSLPNLEVVRRYVRPPGMTDDKGASLGLTTVRFSPDGRHVATAGYGGEVLVWRVADGALVKSFNSSGRKIETLNWTPDGRFLIQAGHEKDVRFYRTSDILDPAITGDALPVVHRAPVSDALEFTHFNRQGTLLATAHQDGTVQLWTYMSDDPLINGRRHAEVTRIQQEAAAQGSLGRTERE